jgi:hypothetical protein
MLDRKKKFKVLKKAAKKQWYLAMLNHQWQPLKAAAIYDKHYTQPA